MDSNLIFVFFFLSLFIRFERGRDSTSGGRAERGGESQAGSALSAWNLVRGLNL